MYTQGWEPLNYKNFKERQVKWDVAAQGVEV